MGFVGFIATGLSGVIPWNASGAFAGAFLSLIVIVQTVEYFQTPKKPKPPPTPVYQNQDKIESSPQPAPAPKSEPKSKTSPKSNRTISLENSPIEEVVMLRDNSSVQYQAKLRKNELLTVEAGTGPNGWILLEIIDKSGYVERSKEGRNLNMPFQANRNGNWSIEVTNGTKRVRGSWSHLTVKA